MSCNQGLSQLYQYALEYRLEEFDTLLADLEAVHPPEALTDAWRMRAQIKLYTSSGSILDDLEKAGPSDKSNVPQFPCLTAQWKADAPNRFIVFSAAAGSLCSFFQSLVLARESLTHWFGGQGANAVRQIQADIHYFTGKPAAALALMEEQRQAGFVNATDEILSQCLRFRCHLALGRTKEAEQCMMDLFRLSQKHPECISTYEALRSWANMTTGWNGETPRFGLDHDGKTRPVLEDRLAGIRMGIARNTPMELPFVWYAKRNHADAYTLRQYYMDLFHALYWLLEGAFDQAEACFLRVYRVAQDSGVCMPFIECGEHVAPLLEYIKSSGVECDADWLDRILEMALDYEENLHMYRG